MLLSRCNGSAYNLDNLQCNLPSHRTLVFLECNHQKRQRRETFLQADTPANKSQSNPIRVITTTRAIKSTNYTPFLKSPREYRNLFEIHILCVCVHALAAEPAWNYLFSPLLFLLLLRVCGAGFCLIIALLFYHFMYLFAFGRCKHRLCAAFSFEIVSALHSASVGERRWHLIAARNLHGSLFVVRTCKSRVMNAPATKNTQWTSH